MDEKPREIAYDRTGKYVLDVCPMCGLSCVGKRRMTACVDCWPLAQTVTAKLAGFDGEELTAKRDAVYELGVRLRAEGKLPPLKGLGLTTYAMCAGCCTSPCDCEAPHWNYMYQSDIQGPIWNLRLDQDGRGATRSHAIDSQLRAAAGRPEKFGPVQRITDPPYDFDKQVRGGAGTHIQKVEIICKGTDDPSRVARLTLKELQTIGAQRVGSEAKPPEPMLTCTQAQLARLLFETQGFVEAELAMVVEPGADPERIRDIMWAGKEGQGSTLPRARAVAEETAAKVFARGTEICASGKGFKS